MTDNRFGFNKIKAQFLQVIKPELPKKIAQHILLFYRTNYNKEGFDDGSFHKWQERKRKVDRKMLVKTGTLRDGIYIKKQTFSLIKIGNDVEYFKFHNEGTDTLPERPMIYESATLDKEVEKIITENLSKLFR